MTEVRIILMNKLGLHARPAAEMTRIANKFKSKITLYGNDKVADAKSILMVMTMGVKQGNELTIRADGPDEDLCINALKELVENKFYEE